MNNLKLSALLLKVADLSNLVTELQDDFSAEIISEPISKNIKAGKGEPIQNKTCNDTVNNGCGNGTCTGSTNQNCSNSVC